MHGMNNSLDLRVPRSEQDDPEFIAMVSRLLGAVVARNRPEDVYVVELDKWFGPGWLRWPAGWGSLLRVRWFDSLIIPSFNPNRVRGQLQYRRASLNPLEYVEEPPTRLHLPYAAHPQTRWRLTRGLTQSGVFLWFSSMTRQLDRASVMAYEIRQRAAKHHRPRPVQRKPHLLRTYRARLENERYWHLDFLKAGQWKLTSAHGIRPRQALQLMGSLAAEVT